MKTDSLTRCINVANVSILDHKAWLAKAANDLKVVRLCLKEQDPLDIAVYHTQQAAEKALKAFLVFHTKQIRKTHDLLFLTDQCIVIDFSFVQIQAYACALNAYATYARYPDDFFTIDYEEAKAAYKKALAIIDFITKRLPK